MIRALRSCRLIACGLPALLVLPAWPAAGALAVLEPAVPIDQQIVEQITAADATRGDGRYAEAARMYADAYRLTTTDQAYRNSDVAVEVVIQAATAYRAAFRASSRDTSLCEESRALLSSFVTDWEATGNAVPPVVADELRWVEERLAEAPPQVPAEPTEPVPSEPPEPEPSETPGEQLPPPDVPEPDPITDGPPDRSSKILGISLLTGGAAATATGVILLAIGAPLRGRAEQYRDETTASPEWMALPAADQQTATGYLDRYVDDERRRGIGLMVAGGAALGVAVAALVVGGISLARARRGRRPSSVTSRLHPRTSLRRHEVTLGLSVDF